MAVATHHSALRRQKTATAEATTSVAGDTEFFSLYEEELGGTRPDRLYEVRPQERDQRRTVEQICDYTLIVPSLDVLVPQMANQLLEVCRQIDTPIPEQVIDVPKISSSRQSHRRRVPFAEQTAEQLVEVTTIISYSSLRGIVEQNVDIPVPHGRGRVGLGLHPGQSSTAYSGADFLQAATAVPNVDIPVPRGRRDLLSGASSTGLPGTANQGVFGTFPRGKMCAVGSAPAVGTGCGHQLVHAGGSATGFLQGCSWCVDAVSQWLVETSGFGPRSLAAWVKAGTGPSSCVSLRDLLEAFPGLCARAVRTWNQVHYFSVPVSGSHCSGRLGVALVAKIGFFGR